MKNCKKKKDNYGDNYFYSIGYRIVLFVQVKKRIKILKKKI